LIERIAGGCNHYHCEVKGGCHAHFCGKCGFFHPTSADEVISHLNKVHGGIFSEEDLTDVEQPV